MLMMTEAAVTMTRGCSYCKCWGNRIDLVVSIYQHSCMGNKGTDTGNCKINRNQEMLNIDKGLLRLREIKTFCAGCWQS